MLTFRRIPIGMTTKQFDIEEESWEDLLWNCDLIHLRMLLGSIQTDIWPKVYKNAFEYVPKHSSLGDLMANKPLGT